MSADPSAPRFTSWAGCLERLAREIDTPHGRTAAPAFESDNLREIAAQLRKLAGARERPVSADLSSTGREPAAWAIVDERDDAVCVISGVHNREEVERKARQWNEGITSGAKFVVEPLYRQPAPLASSSPEGGSSEQRLAGIERRNTDFFPTGRDEVAWLLSQVRALSAQVRSLRDGESSPWPARDVVKKLADAAEHLLSDHDCDRHGHEEVRFALTAARAFLSGSVPTQEGETNG